jgi:hypothetical protein
MPVRKFFGFTKNSSRYETGHLLLNHDMEAQETLFAFLEQQPSVALPNVPGSMA